MEGHPVEEKASAPSRSSSPEESRSPEFAASSSVEEGVVDKKVRTPEWKERKWWGKAGLVCEHGAEAALVIGGLVVAPVAVVGTFAAERACKMAQDFGESHELEGAFGMSGDACGKIAKVAKWGRAAAVGAGGIFLATVNPAAFVTIPGIVGISFAAKKYDDQRFKHESEKKEVGDIESGDRDAGRSGRGVARVVPELAEGLAARAPAARAVVSTVINVRPAPSATPVAPAETLQAPSKGRAASL